MRRHIPETRFSLYGAENLKYSEVTSAEELTQMEDFFRNLKVRDVTPSQMAFLPNEIVAIDDLPVAKEGYNSQKIIHATWDSKTKGQQEMYFLEVTRKRDGSSYRSWLNLSYLIISKDQQYPDDLRRIMCQHFSSTIARIDFLRGLSLLANEKQEDLSSGKLTLRDLTVSAVGGFPFGKEKTWSMEDFQPFQQFSDAISLLEQSGGLNKEIDLSVRDNRRWGYLQRIVAMIRLINSIDSRFDEYYTLTLKRNVIWKDSRICIDYIPERSEIAINVGQTLSNCLFEDMRLRDINGILLDTFKQQRDVFKNHYPASLFSYYDRKLKDLARAKDFDFVQCYIINQA